ncbi:MAG: metal-dependent hydrolase [Candidatus Deferrimicrobiaceae bacterium]
MDTITHGLTGWLISRAIPSDSGRREATAAVVVGSLLPDADNITSLLGSESYLRLHRGLSHGFAGIAVTSLLIALLLYRFGKWKDLKKLYLLALLGQLSHVALDLLNSYGTQIFQPFSDARVSFDLLFVVDLVFTGIIVTGLLLSRRRSAPARAAILGLCVYVGFATFLHVRVEDAVRTAASQHGVRVVSATALPRLPEVHVGNGISSVSLVRKAWAQEEADTLPNLPIPDRPGLYPFPAGPFAWNGFIDDGKTYLRAEVNPFTGTVAWKQRVRRGADLPEVRAVEEIPDVRTYLWFARFPVVTTSHYGEETILVFSDLRFGEVPGRRRPFVLRVIEAPGRSPVVHWGG